MADKHNGYHVDFVEWCAEQRANALKNIELIDADGFKFGIESNSQPLKDKRPELRATYERIYNQMDALIKEYSSTRI